MHKAIKRTGWALAGVVALAVGAVNITNDGGGDIQTYVNKYAALKAQGQSVVISGECASACTIGLGYSNVCFMPGTVLGFHPGYDKILFGWLGYHINAAGTRTMWFSYPADAQAVILQHDDLWQDPGVWENPRDPGAVWGGWGFGWYPKPTFITISAFPAHYMCGATASESRAIEPSW